MVRNIVRGSRLFPICWYWMQTAHGMSKGSPYAPSFIIRPIIKMSESTKIFSIGGTPDGKKLVDILVLIKSSLKSDNYNASCRCKAIRDIYHIGGGRTDVSILTNRIKSILKIHGLNSGFLGYIPHANLKSS